MSYRVAELAEIVGGQVQGDPERQIEGIRTLECAGPGDLSFVTSSRYRRQAAASRAGVLLAREPIAGVDKDFLLAADPYFALAQLMTRLHAAPEVEPGIHPTAVIAPTAEVDERASIGPCCVVGERARIGAEAVLHAHVVIGAGCAVGQGSVLHPHVTLYPGCVLGRRCILHAGVVLGSDGFGYALHEGTHVKLQHAGSVVVEDDVEIGANSTVDRALLEETRIGTGSKIDNLVQVAHNVRLGRGCLLVSQAGIAGSSTLGDYVVVAGQSGVSGHMVLGDRVQVAAKSAVFKPVEAGSTVAGIPARDISAWRRQQVLVARLGEIQSRLSKLEAQVTGKEKGDTGES